MKIETRRNYIIRSVKRFIVSCKDPSVWKGSLSDYIEENERFARYLITLLSECSDESLSAELSALIETLASQKMQFQSYWLDKTISIVEELSEEQKDILQEQNEIKEALSHFETRMIEVFSVVMGLISFVFVTAEKVSELDFLDCLKFCLIYIFSISLFVALIKCIMTKKMDTDDLKTLGVIISVPFICVLLLILMIFLI